MTSPLLKPLLLSAALFAGLAAEGIAQPLTCPDPASVFAAADAGGPPAIKLSTLADEIGRLTTAATAPENVDLGGLVASIRQDYPQASDAEVADLLVTGYCAFLQTATTPDENAATSLKAFETYADAAVFKAPHAAPSKAKGWLYEQG